MKIYKSIYESREKFGEPKDHPVPDAVIFEDAMEASFLGIVDVFKKMFPTLLIGKVDPMKSRAEHINFDVNRNRQEATFDFFITDENTKAPKKFKKDNIFYNRTTGPEYSHEEDGVNYYNIVYTITADLVYF